MENKSLQEMLESLAIKSVQELLKIIDKGDATPQHLAVARAILRDNNITAASLPGNPLSKLGEALNLPGLPDSVYLPQ